MTGVTFSPRVDGSHGSWVVGRARPRSAGRDPRRLFTACSDASPQRPSPVESRIPKPPRQGRVGVRGLEQTGDAARVS